MKQLTLKELFNLIALAIKEGNGDKKVIISNDNERNGYHGLFYGVTEIDDKMADAIDGLMEDSDTDINNLIIIG